MNILFLFGHNLVIGGHFKSAQAFISELILCGHKVHVLAPNGAEETISPFLHVGATFSNIVYCHGRNLISRIINLFVLNKQIKETIHKFDIDIVHVQDSPALLEGFKTACFYKKAFILTQAGGPFINFYPPPKIHFILYSQELYERYLRLTPKPICNFQVISERINSKIYYTSKIEKSDFNLPNIGLTFFFAMRLHEQKRAWITSLFYFIEKIELNEITNFIIAGDGTLKNEMIEKASYIKRKKNHLNFIFVGDVADETEINALINYSNICIGNGRLLMEAMACRKPVIILGQNNQFEMVDDSNIALVRKYNFSGRHFDEKSHNIENQTRVIEKLLTLKDLDRLGEFSFKYFSQFLSSNIGAEKLLSIYSMATSSIKNGFFDYLSWLIKSHIDKYISKLSKRN